MKTTKIREVLEQIHWPPKCTCGDPVCDKHADWRMTHEECEALRVAARFYIDQKFNRPL